MIAKPSLDIEIPSCGVDKLVVRGRWKCWLSNPKSGSVVKKPWYIDNGVCTAGINYLLNTGFRNQAQITSWYVGIVAASAFSTVSANDTMGSHGGWAELITYDEVVRQTWTPAAASGGVLANSAAMSFAINASVNAQGLFVTSSNAKSGTTGTLWSTAVNATPFAVTDTVAFNAIYELTMTPVS